MPVPPSSERSKTNSSSKLIDILYTFNLVNSRVTGRNLTRFLPFNIFLASALRSSNPFCNASMLNKGGVCKSARLNPKIGCHSEDPIEQLKKERPFILTHMSTMLKIW